MPLTVLSVAFPFAAVGPHAVGGAERILTDMDEGLTAAGHRSLVVACDGSRTAGELFSFPLPQAAIITDAMRQEVQRQCQAAIDRALAAHPVDLVHLHGMDFDTYRLPEGIPVLVTLHLPIAWYRREALARPGTVFACVSESQRRTWPAGVAVPGEVVVVENGVSIPVRWNQGQRENFALVLGRICPEKNQHEALEAANLAGVPVWIGGHTFPYPEHQAYYAESIGPLLASTMAGVPPRHRFFDSIPPHDKRELLSRALCLLHPTRAPETSSLVAMEAMAAGTPVIAYPSGALADIVEDRVTGFLVNSVGEMAEAVGRVGEIARTACRSSAERRFSKERMIGAYLHLYSRLAGKPREKVTHA